MKVFSVLFIMLVFSIGIENEGSFRVIEAKTCEIKLYDYCDDTCFTECVRRYESKVSPVCNEVGQCICRYHC
ncbi:hypothetical protein JHK87_023259 [Glycine soja]|nr:hypothetical protein JHK87_023259 [Glycine soja]